MVAQLMHGVAEVFTGSWPGLPWGGRKETWSKVSQYHSGSSREGVLVNVHPYISWTPRTKPLYQSPKNSYEVQLHQQTLTQVTIWSFSLPACGIAIVVSIPSCTHSNLDSLSYFSPTMPSPLKTKITYHLNSYEPPCAAAAWLSSSKF